MRDINSSWVDDDEDWLEAQCCEGHLGKFRFSEDYRIVDFVTVIYIKAMIMISNNLSL
jgi:hypothetical protein